MNPVDHRQDDAAGESWLTWSKLGGMSLICGMLLAATAVATGVTFIWAGVIACILLGLGFLAKHLKEDALRPPEHLLGYAAVARWQKRVAVCALLAGFFGPLLKPGIEAVKAGLTTAPPSSVYNITKMRFCPLRPSRACRGSHCHEASAHRR